MRSELVLIGPIRAGKSTLAAIISARIGLRQCSMDDYRWKYYDEIGYDAEHAAELKKRFGFRGVYDYWKPFEAHAVERLLSENSDCIFDFGAGHSVYEDPGLFERVQEALAPFENIVLLLPCPDAKESIEILAQRGEALSESVREINAHFVRHPSNDTLAKHVVYNHGKTEDEAAGEIIRLLRIQS